MANRKLFDIPVDEDSLIRHYSLSPMDRLETELRRRDHNRLAFAIQLCLMRYRVEYQRKLRLAPCQDILLINARSRVAKLLRRFSSEGT